MKRIIHHVRRQPEHIKRHILHILTIVLGIVLILLWVYSLGVNLTNPDTKLKASNDLKPLSALKDNMANGYYSISNSENQQ
ncbi:MAG: hypothetical protein AAB687_00510 [Patescibacteria group bacterium]